MTTDTAQIEKTMQAMRETTDPQLRVCRRIEIGQNVQQGDVYLWRVADTHPRGKQRAEGERQVAVGTTIGARHVAEGDAIAVFEGKQLPEGVKFQNSNANQACLGPVVAAPEGLTLTHPEHAHFRMPAGTYQVTYQIDERTQRAVQD